MTLILSIFSCEETFISKSLTSTDPNAQILARSSCEDCSTLEYEGCCCGIWLQPLEDEAHISLCGTTDGPNACTGQPNSPCTNFSGGGYSFTLILDDPRKPFCMEQGTSFWVANTHATDTAKVIISCKGHFTNLDTTWLQIPPQTRLYFNVNTDCETEPCP